MTAICTNRLDSQDLHSLQVTQTPIEKKDQFSVINRFDNFKKFIDQFRVNKTNGSQLTHYAMSGGLYNIPDNSKQDLCEFLAHEYDNKRYHSIVEAPQKGKPSIIKFDFDFKKANASTLEHLYDQSHLTILTDHLQKAIRFYLDVPDEDMLAYIFERSPRLDGKTLKDGIHILFPRIICEFPIQLLIRSKLIELSRNFILQLGISNTIEKIIDDSVFGINGWLMYGCTKPKTPEPYKLTHIYDYDCDDRIDETKLTTFDLIWLLTTRDLNPDMATTILMTIRTHQHLLSIMDTSISISHRLLINLLKNIIRLVTLVVLKVYKRNIRGQSGKNFF